jgi:hypothetical protein
LPPKAKQFDAKLVSAHVTTLPDPFPALAAGTITGTVGALAARPSRVAFALVAFAVVAFTVDCVGRDATVVTGAFGAAARVTFAGLAAGALASVSLATAGVAINAANATAPTIPVRILKLLVPEPQAVLPLTEW